MSAWVVRRAGPHDVARVVALTLPDAYPGGPYRAELRDTPEHLDAALHAAIATGHGWRRWQDAGVRPTPWRLYVAEADREVIGFLLAMVNPDFGVTGGRVWVELSMCSVDPAYRGRGAASRLVRHALADYRAGGRVQGFCAECWVGTPAVRSLLRRAGLRALPPQPDSPERFAAWEVTARPADP